MWNGPDRFNPDAPLHGTLLALFGAGVGAVLLFFAVGDLWNMADAGDLPQLRMTVTSCRSDTSPGSHRQPTITCYGAGTDGPSGVTAERWQLDDTPHAFPVNEVVNVRCTRDGSCTTDLGQWGVMAVAELSAGVLFFAAGAYTGSRVLVHRYAPWHDDFFMRRSTVVTTIVVFFAIIALGIVGGILIY